MVQPCPSRGGNGVGDSRERRHDRRLADATHTIRVAGVRRLDDHCIDHRHVGRDGDSVVEEPRVLEPAVRASASQLVVMCGSGPGQRAWDSEEWRCGAFTQAVLEGLRGGAAPPNMTAISAWDLFDYVKRTTEKWTTANRPVGQTPILLPDPAAGGRERAQLITVAVSRGDYVPADPAERGRMATDNLDKLLKAAGATWEHIVFNVNYSAPGGGGINFRDRMGTWSPCSTSLRVTDTGIPGVNTLYQITAVAPHRAITTRGPVPGIEV